MSEGELERLARIEAMLEGHFQRDDERLRRIDALEATVAQLKTISDKMEGGYKMLALLLAAAATIGGLIAKLLPWGAR